MLVLAAGITAAAINLRGQVAAARPSDADTSVIQRAQVWKPTSIPTMDLKQGPQGAGAFPFRARVVCDYLDKKLDGHSPKFACAIGEDDDVKVKFGAANGEVYGEDSKPQQQRVLCLGADVDRAKSCQHPFLLISDVGLTFGRASRTNANATGGANLAAWRQTPIWKYESGCIGNLPKSLTGTLADPPISEEGRQFLAELLGQLSDRQIEDLFDAARVALRYRSPGDANSGVATVPEWVDAFREKREQIFTRRCTT